jgi:hypothetical protein
MSGEVFELATSNITRWTLAEMVKAATAKAKNDLETYIINTREKLETDELYQQVRLIQGGRRVGRQGERGLARDRVETGGKEGRER